jgi:MFS family permease
VVLANVALPMFGLSILSAHMSDQSGFGRAATGSAYSVFTIMSGLPAPVAAFMIDRWGVKWTLVIGNLLLAGGAAALAVLPASPATLILFAGVVIGIGTAIGGVMPTTAGAAYWFTERRALAIAIIMSASSIGGAVFPPVLEALISVSGGNWRLGWWVIAVLEIVVTVLAIILVVNRPEDIGQVPKGTLASGSAAEVTVTVDTALATMVLPKVHVSSEPWTFREAVRRPSYWLLVCCSIAALGAFTIFFGQGIVHIRDLGHSMDTAASLLSAAVVIGFLAHMATGALGDRLDPQHMWAGGLAAQGLGTLLFISFSSMPMLILSIALIGGGASASMLCILALISNWYGAQAYAALAGTCSAIATVGGLSSYLAGLSFDRWGSYLPAYWAVAIPCLVCSVLLFIQKPPRLKLAAPVRPATAAA